MKSDPRVVKSTRSVKALHNLLKEIVLTPAEFADNEILKKALKSQGALSKLDIVERNITGTSLNTVKRISDTVLDGGFDEINLLRIAALDAINGQFEKEKQSNKITKIGLSKKVKELEEELQHAFQDLWHITMAFEKALIQGRSYAKQGGNPAVLALCEREQRELKAMFTLCKHHTLHTREKYSGEAK